MLLYIIWWAVAKQSIVYILTILLTFYIGLMYVKSSSRELFLNIIQFSPISCFGGGGEKLPNEMKELNLSISKEFGI